MIRTLIEYREGSEVMCLWHEGKKRWMQFQMGWLHTFIEKMTFVQRRERGEEVSCMTIGEKRTAGKR